MSSQPSLLQRVLIGVLFSVVIVALQYGIFYSIGKPQSLGALAIPTDKKLQCVSYAPLEKDQSPQSIDLNQPFSATRIDTDLAILAKNFSCIRTYSSTGMQELPSIAAKYGLQLMLGAWVSSDSKATQMELDNLIALAKANPANLKAVIVGNEALLRKDVTGKQLADYIHYVKLALPGVPVTYADVWEFWLKNAMIGELTDFVTIHILPYWEDDPTAIDEAMVHIKNTYDEVQQKIPGKELLIGETGWPSEGRMREGALPSVVNQALFMRSFIHLAEQEKWQYNLIEAFDQPWKRWNEGAVGGYWGIYDADRQDKNILAGEISLFPNWHLLFQIVAVSALLCLAIIFYLSPNIDCTVGCGSQYLKRWLMFLILSVAGPVLIVLQANQYFIISRNTVEHVWAVVTLATASGVHLLSLYALVTGVRFKPINLIETPMLIRASNIRQLECINGLLWVVILGCVIVGTIGMLFDARYRSFDNYALLLPAITYLWLFKIDGEHSSQKFLEKFWAIVLTLSAVLILINETYLNLQAVIWSGICLLIAIPLWRLSYPTPLNNSKPMLLTIVFAFVCGSLIRYQLMEPVEFLETCSATPNAPLCLLRSAVGFSIHFELFGLGSLVVVLLALWRQAKTLSYIALWLSIFAAVLYNINYASISFVLATFVIARIQRA